MKKRRQSIGRKITATIITAVFIAVTGATGFFLWRQTSQNFHARHAELEITANVFSSVVAPHLARRDKTQTLVALRAIAKMPSIPYIAVIDRNEKSFAALGSAILVTSGEDTRNAGGFLDLLLTAAVPVKVPVIDAGEEIGALVLLADISDLRNRLQLGLLLTLAVATAASLLGVAFANTMRRKIVAPLTDLSRAMSEVRTTHDFSMRVDKSSDDETGDLVDSFNDMLAQISVRDTALSRHRDTLEQTVADRTRELRVARDSAEAANKAKSDFLATMSHEIRTPMNGVMVMAELLAAAELPPRQQRYAEVIVRSGQSLLTIINDILDLSKIEAGKLDLEQVAVSPCGVIDDVMSLFWERASSKGLDLAAFVTPDVPHLIIADPVRLNQVLSNLVNNALKFTENGHVAVHVRTQGRTDDHVTLEFSVIDTGIGIPADKIGKLFEAFSQADQSTTRKFGGTGLGLAISKRLVEAMGGDIKVESREGKGSRFSFRIEARVEDAGCGVERGQLGALRKAVVATSGSATPQAIASYLQVHGIETAIVAPQSFTLDDIAGCQAIFGEPRALAALCEQTTAMSGLYRIVVTEIGDMAGEDLIRAGLADDIIMRPASRREMHEMVERLARGERRGVAALSATPGDALVLPDFAGARILVADDSAVNREVIIEALRRFNVSVDVAANGREAVDAWTSGAYRLVFMDCSMPVMDGFEATATIRRAEAQHDGAGRTPIIALTAHVAGSDSDRWRRAGMDDYVIKPFTIKTIARCLIQWLGDPAGSADLGGNAAPSPPTPAATNVVATSPEIATAGQAGADVPLLDQTVLSDLGGDGSDLVIRVSRLFTEHVPGALAEIGSIADGGDLAALADAVHALKSMCANIGAARAAAACHRLETRVRTGQDCDVAAHVAAIAREAQAALTAVADLTQAA